MGGTQNVMKIKLHRANGRYRDVNVSKAEAQMESRAGYLSQRAF